VPPHCSIVPSGPLTNDSSRGLERFEILFKVIEFSKHIGHNRNYGFRKSALEDASEATHPKPFRLRELLGRVAQDAAAHRALWPTTVEHYPGTPT